MATHQLSANGNRPALGPAFPQRNAFVLQFAAETGPRPGPVRGRIQHVTSGEQSAFESLDELWGFVSRVLFAADPSPEPADG
jgi:hypothetical protein